MWGLGGVPVKAVLRSMHAPGVIMALSQTAEPLNTKPMDVNPREEDLY